MSIEALSQKGSDEGGENKEVTNLSVEVTIQDKKPKLDLPAITPKK
jgi:hypothetical protein